MKQIIKWLSLVFLILVNDGCKNTDVKEDIRTQSSDVNEVLWSVTSINGFKLIEVKEKATISALREALDDRIEVKLKRLPNFDFEIIVKEDATSKVWLYSSNGYVMSKKDQQKRLFKVKLTRLNKMLQ